MCVLNSRENEKLRDRTGFSTSVCLGAGNGNQPSMCRVGVWCTRHMGRGQSVRDAVIQDTLCAKIPFKCYSTLLLRLGQIAARGDNIERFLMGRQVFITVFLLHPCETKTSSSISPTSSFSYKMAAECLVAVSR